MQSWKEMLRNPGMKENIVTVPARVSFITGFNEAEESRTSMNDRRSRLQREK